MGKLFLLVVFLITGILMIFKLWPEPPPEKIVEFPSWQLPEEIPETLEEAAKKRDCSALNMVDLGDFCIDKYEASRWDATATSSGFSFIPASQKGVVPWTSISQTEAKRACQLARKRLCTNSEWQRATETFPDQTTCPHGNNNFGQAVENFSETCLADPTYPYDRCLTGTGPATWSTKSGVCDLNGNVWEWVDGFYGHLSACNLITRGYITDWNWDLNCPANRGRASEKYGQDFYWPPFFPGAGAILRSGAWTTGEGAGCFVMTLWNPPSHANPHIGFRCCL
jgi:formylglycine-generating enzyme required for sulfatase activity